MGEPRADNRDTQREEYLATLPADKARRLEAISLHRKIIGIPDWFCSESPSHAHHWLQEEHGGSWICKFCRESVRSWPNISLLDVSHIRELKKKTAELLAEESSI